MSLFNQTVKRVSELEAELAEAHMRIKSLESALKAARADRLRAMERGGGTPWRDLKSRDNPTPPDVNSLSDDEVEQLFAMHDEAKMAEAVDAGDLKSPARKGMSVRSRLLAPIAALLKRA